MKKRQFKKDKKKGKHTFFVGRISSFVWPFWESELKEKLALQQSGTVRTSRMKDKLQKRIDKLHYLLWEHNISRKRMHLVMELCKEAGLNPMEMTDKDWEPISRRADSMLKTPEVKFRDIEGEKERVRRKTARWRKRV